MSQPAAEIAWVTAKRETPRREPFTDEELKELRINFCPRFGPARGADVSIVVWTLLDMLEAQKGWTE